MTTAAAVIVAGAASSLGGIAWNVMAVVGCIVTGCTVLFVLLCLVATRKRKPRHVVILPPEVGDDTLAMLAQRRPAAPRRGCDEDTVLINGLTTDLNELLRGDGRG